GFGPQSNVYSNGTSLAVVAADMDGDGKLDLVTPIAEVGHVRVFLGHGDGTFSNDVDDPAGSNPSAVAVADLNGDGLPDLAIANQTQTGSVTVTFNKGGGVFGVGAEYPTSDGPAAIVAADLNGDGRPDLVVANRGVYGGSVTGSEVSVLVNEG